MTVDLFLQRDADGTADIHFDGDRARLWKDGQLVRDWTSGGVLADVPQGDGYRLDTDREGTFTAKSVAIGVIAVAAGQSNINGWFGGDYVRAETPHTYQYNGTGWGSVRGDGARTFTSVLAAQLGVPVAIVNTAIGGTGLFYNPTSPYGFWLDTALGTPFANFAERTAAIGGKAEYLIWSQGESDASTGLYDRGTYLAGLEDLFDRFRTTGDFGSIGIVELGYLAPGRTFGNDATFDEVRAAQHQAADGFADVLIGGRVAGLEHYDYVHLTSISLAFQAARMAFSLLAELDLGTGYLTRAGSDLADAIPGGAGRDQIIGRGGDDRLDALGGDDIIDGGAGADRIGAGDGDDLVRGDVGTDSILGGSGTDLISGGAGADRISGGSGNDEIWGDDGNDVVRGNEGNDVLRGNAGNDRVDGGTGADRIYGGTGDDVLGVDDLGDVLFERPEEGNDTVEASISFDLSLHPDIENLVLTAPGLAGWGNAGANRLEARGLAGVLAGRGGDDVYIVNDPGDVVKEAAGKGADMVFSATSYVVPAHVEHLVFTGTADIDATGTLVAERIDGNAGANRIRGGGGADILAGGAGGDVYYVGNGITTILEQAGGGRDTIVSSASIVLAANVENLVLAGANAIGGAGNEQANTITGNSAGNLLEGRGGDDTIDGGAGVDVALFDLPRGQAQVRRQADGSYVVFSAAGTDRLRNIEILQFADGSRYAIDSLAGLDPAATPLADDLAGTSGVDTIDGGEGDDRIDGMDGDDLLRGGGGDDWLIGGSGSDQLFGGPGDDVYVIDAATDSVSEDASSGTDTVRTRVNYALPAHVESIVLLGSSAINATGNGLDNQLTGNAGNGTLAGGAGSDRYFLFSSGARVVENGNEGTDTVYSTVSRSLEANVENLILTGQAALSGTGNELDNQITGNDGANILSGGAGADRMTGGKGNDVYVVDSALDQTIELEGGGRDTVRSSVSFTLETHVENLVYTGSAGAVLAGNDLGNRIIGGTGNDTLSGLGGADFVDGGAGADSMTGGDGDDVYVIDHSTDRVFEYAGTGVAQTGYDTARTSVSWTMSAFVEAAIATGDAAINITGNTAGNIITGNAAANRIDGGGGTDTMIGGMGNDIYMVDRSSDQVIEGAAAGIDTVHASVSVLLSANVENVVLLGSAEINAAGNALANRIDGNTGANVLLGGQGNDTIDGGDGDDRLSGGEGSDAMRGGAGDDVYFVDRSTDIVIEQAGGGSDTVHSDVDWTLGSNVEDLVLTGGTAIEGRGNDMANRISGNAAANILTGQGGADEFLFVAAPGSSGVDTITDFTTGVDMILLDRSAFGGMAQGTLNPASFALAGASLTSATRMIYDSATGALLFDQDGSGSGLAVQFAQLDRGLALSAQHFLVV